MEAEALFKKLLRHLRPLFKAHGFRSANQNFILESTECWVIVNFQKSYYADRGEKTFYINIGATAKRLLDFNGESSAKAPRYYACEWRWRAEEFGPDNATLKQWTIRDEESAEAVR